MREKEEKRVIHSLLIVIVIFLIILLIMTIFFLVKKEKQESFSIEKIIEKDIYIKNTGKIEIKKEEIKIYAQDKELTFSSPSVVLPGQTAILKILGNISFGVAKLKISSRLHEEEITLLCISGEKRNCSNQNGVCAGSRETCSNNNWAGCNYFSVLNYEIQETRCDGKDNDCDGSVDENLTTPLCELQAGVCKNSVKTCGGTSGWLPCDDSSYGTDFRVQESKCSDGLDNDCDELTDITDLDCFALKNLVFYTKSPWLGFSETESAGAGISEIQLKMARNEFEPAVVMIKNSGEDKTISISVTDLVNQNGQIIPSSQIRIRKTGKVYLSSERGVTEGYYIDPLCDEENCQNGGARVSPLIINSPSGKTIQIWLTIQTKNNALGDYYGDVLFKVGQSTSIVKIKVTVWNFALPYTTSTSYSIIMDPYSGTESTTCAYKTLYTRIQGKGLQDTYYQNFAEHYSDIIVTGSGSTPYPKCDINGNYLGQEGSRNLFSNKDAEININKKYGFMTVIWVSPKWFSLPVGSNEWKKCMQGWIPAWVNHLKTVNGLSYGDFTFKFVDEPVDIFRGETVWNSTWPSYTSDVVITMAKTIKEIDPNIKTMENPFYVSSSYNTYLSKLQEMRNYIDIWEPHIDIWYSSTPQAYRGFFAEEKNNGKKIWMYEPVGDINRWTPYPQTAFTWYRLLAWHAFKNEAEGVDFWTAMSWRGDPWNDFAIDTCDTGSEVLALYSGEKGPVDSRRWEGWREGIEDYKYLTLLKQKISLRGDAQAQSVLNEAVNWATSINRQDRTISINNYVQQLETYRERIAAEILRLS